MLKKKIITILLPIQILIVYWLSHYPDFIEKYYSNGIYPIISSFFRIILGWIPFSVGDIFLLIALFLIIKRFWQLITRKARVNTRSFFNFTSKISILYFCFYLFWGMNYYRKPLAQNIGLTIPNYDIEEITVLTEKLLVKTQEIHFQLTKNDTIPVQTVYSQTELLQKTGDGYEILAKKYPELKYSFTKVKKSIFSIPMSYMGFSGYINPLTGESQVSYTTLDYNIPAIACHEAAHQIGYANESEANFIGYLAAIHNKDLLFQYSGYLMALEYALGNIYRKDKDLFNEIRNRLPIGVKKNLKERFSRHEKYKNPLMHYFHEMYSTYLKANKQKDGMKSYSNMIGLVMAYEDK